MNKILVPYDFSQVAQNALNFAVQLAEGNPSTDLMLLSVIEHPTPDSFKTMGVSDYDPMENIYLTKLIESVKRKMEDLVSGPEMEKVNVVYKIRVGSAFHEISDEIKKIEASLVVMGTSGASGLDEYLVGSNAERVVRNANCPVITLREPCDVASINEVVFASNFHDVSPHFVDHVLKLQNALDAKLRLVKINTPANFTSTRHDNEQMDDFVKRFDIQNCSTDIYNYSNEEDGIVAYTEDIDADMIALGTHQRTGVGHFLQGSIAEDVVNHAKRPVWTFNLNE